MLSHIKPKKGEGVQAVVKINNEVAGKNVPYLYNSLTLDKFAIGTTGKIAIFAAKSIDVTFTAMTSEDHTSKFKVTFLRTSTADLAKLVIEHGGAVVWIIIGCVLFCLLCVGIIVWRKCFHKKSEDFYFEDCYSRV